jgi:HAD superfamily phosphoserine phosphatase-like hydrolase
MLDILPYNGVIVTPLWIGSEGGAMSGRIATCLPRLPEADGPDRGEVPGADPPLRLAILGDSSAAGVGAPTHGEALAGRFATELARLTGRGVWWRVLARTGATVRDVARGLVPRLTDPTQSWAPDAVVVVAGVNDLTRLRPGPAWRRDVAGLVAAIRLRLGGRPTVLLAGLPPIHRFPALPWTVRWPLGAHARWLDHQLARLAGEEPDCHHLPVRRLPVEPTRFFAADRFHPSPVGYRVWSQALASQAAALLAPAAPAGAPVVLFDFDGVLIRGDSYAHLVRRELQRSWWRRLAMLPVLAAAMPMLKVPALRRSGQRLVVRLAFVGYSTAQFNGRAAEFGRHLARDQQVVVGDAVAAARRHLSSGARVVVVTASAQPLVRAVLDELGLSSVELIASQPACGRLGLRAPLRNHGAEKLRQLAAHRLQPPWQIAYSDSASDLPMLHGAVRPILVNPDARLLAHARREFGQRISSVQWC